MRPRTTGVTVASSALNPMDLGTGRTAVAIAAGGYHSCAVLDDGTAKCWGSNGSGELGQGDTTTRGDGAGEMGDGLDTIDLGTGRTAITMAAGLAHTCAVLDDGTAKCWGENGSGQLGRFNTSDMGDGAGEMGDSLAAIDLGTGRTATVFADGNNHSCALLDSRALRCWGANGQGQLGQGDTFARGDNVAEMALLLPVRLAGNSHVAPIIDVPLPPTGVAAVAGLASATVTWQMPEDNGGRPIQGFRVQSAPAGTSTWTTRIANTGSLDLAALVTGLARGGSAVPGGGDQPGRCRARTRHRRQPSCRPLRRSSPDRRARTSSRCRRPDSSTPGGRTPRSTA